MINRVTKFAEILRGIRASLFGLGRIHIARYVRVERGVKLLTLKNSEISIDKGCFIRSGTYISASGGDIRIGCNTTFNRNITLVAKKDIRIGRGCSFGPGVVIYDHDHKFGAGGIKEGFNCSEVVIGNHCWIGANTIILRGTHIGANCVIGAGCVVKGDIPDNTLVTQGRDLVMKKLEDRNAQK